MVPDQLMYHDPRSSLYPPPGGTLAPESAAGRTVAGRGFTATSLVFSSLAALFVLPGIGSLIFARLGHKRGDPLGRTARNIGWISMALGVVVIALVGQLGEEAGAVVGALLAGRPPA